MFIVMIASECAPVAKVGGLADVVYGLARELEIRGNAVEIVLPKYDCLRYEHIWNMHPVFDDLWVPWGGGQVHCTVWFGFVHGRKCFFIDAHSDELFFNRGTFYGCDDEPMRFAFFSRAALEFLYRSGKRPDVIHTHDWQTGMVAPLLFELYQGLGMQDQRVCHTVHNFKHQGTTGPEVLAATGLGRPDHFLSPDRMGDDWNAGVINFTKAAIVFANFVTTVSPRHAWEARHTDQGFGLGRVLERFQHKFAGILNGLDYDVWNPATDPHVPAHYTDETFERKAVNTRGVARAALVAGVRGSPRRVRGPPRSPEGVASHHPRARSHAGERGAVRAPRRRRRPGDRRRVPPPEDLPERQPRLPSRAGLRRGPGAPDLRRERSDRRAESVRAVRAPQMIALRYGTVPVVRGVGGLRDTVFDRDWSDAPATERNGYVFEHADFPGLESALDRAFALWRDDRDAFRALARTGMRRDHSWNEPGQQYLNVYERIRHR